MLQLNKNIVQLNEANLYESPDLAKLTKFYAPMPEGVSISIAGSINIITDK